MTFKAIVPPTAERPRMENRRNGKSSMIQRMLQSNFELTTLLLIGGLIQGALLLLIPRLWMLLPSILILLGRASHTFAVTFKLIPNPQVKDIIPHRATAVIPDREGDFNQENDATKEKVAILLLGMRINHPLGYLDSYAAKIGQLNRIMQDALDAEAPNNGFLGQSQWTSQSATGSQDILLISYWRSIEDILKFSVGPTHQETWRWWDDNIADLNHIGISHEMFEAPRSMYESVYINFQPTRLGATSFLQRGDESIGGTVPDQWITPLVDASRGKLRHSKGRLGWSTEDELEALKEKQGFYD